MVGAAHVSVFKIIEKIRKKQNQVQLEIESIIQGLPRILPKKDRERESKIQVILYIMIGMIEQSWIFFRTLPITFHFKF